MASDFESYLLGRLGTLEEAARTRGAPQAEAPPVPHAEPTPVELNQHFLDHLEEIAGVRPTPATRKPETPPATLSRQAPDYPRQFAKLAEAIATGRTVVVD